MQRIAQGATLKRIQQVDVINIVPVWGEPAVPLQREAKRGRDVCYDLQVDHLWPQDPQQLLNDQAVHTIQVDDQEIQGPRLSRPPEDELQVRQQLLNYLGRIQGQMHLGLPLSGKQVMHAYALCTHSTETLLDIQFSDVCVDTQMDRQTGSQRNKHTERYLAD